MVRRARPAKLRAGVLWMGIWGLAHRLSVQISGLGPNPAQIQQGFNLHCMGNLMICQIIMHDVEATLVPKDRGKI